MPAVRRVATPALLLLPAALVVYTAFNGGGYFAGTQGWLAVLLAVVLMLRATLAGNAFGGASPQLAVAAGSLVALGAWALASAAWSDAPARALIEFDRVLLYLLALVLFGCLPMTTRRLRWMLLGLAAAAVVVCTVAFVTRALPRVWPITPNIENERLSYPITYWNTLGLLGALGAVLCLHFTCSEREPRLVRVLAAAALPVLATTMYLTFSRAAIGLALIASLVYLAAARPRGAVAGLIAAGPATALAIVTAYDSDALASLRPTSRTAVEQGHDLAVVVTLAALVAAILRVLGLWLDARVARRAEPLLPRRPVIAAGAVAAVAAAGVFVAAGGPGYVERQFDVFVKRHEPRDERTGDRRSRLTDPSSNGRVEQWTVAVDAWRTDRLHGTGAGTYELRWARDRRVTDTVVDGHSLYVEALAELGVVGLLLVATVVLTLLAGALVRIRGPDRALYAAAFAVLLTWALRAGLDWDWEMPVVTLWAFCVGGAVLATPRARAAASAEEPEPRRVGDPPRLMRVLVGVGCLLLAITPWRVARSQGHLDAAVAAYQRGDCPAAVDSALDSLAAEQVRPEPRVVLAYCDLKLGQPRLALRQATAALERDPHAWNLHYLLGVNRALLGRDPRPELERARRSNPKEPLVRTEIRRLRGATAPPEWQRVARRSALPAI